MQQLVLPLNLPPAFEAKDFIVSSSNEEAYLWILKWPNWPYRSLSLYGEKGCGKSHLAKIWQGNTKAVLLKGQDFDQIDPETLFEKSMYFVLDEADLIRDEEKLFHLYNHIIFSQGGLLLLSQLPPSQWALTLPDLKSRLNALPALKIQAPDEELLCQVIQKLFRDAQVNVEPATIYFLLKYIERSFDAAHDWVNKLNTTSLSQNRRITIPLVKELLLKEGMVGTHQSLDLATNQGQPMNLQEAETQ